MSIINFAVNKNQNTNWSDQDGRFCQKRQQILPHIVLSVGNVIYCKQLNDPASMKTKNRNTLMSTEHFSIHQGIFCTYRIKCK